MSLALCDLLFGDAHGASGSGDLLSAPADGAVAVAAQAQVLYSKGYLRDSAAPLTTRDPPLTKNIFPQLLSYLFHFYFYLLS